MPAPRTGRPVRIGYARTSTARQERASQLEAFHRAECHKVFEEQISTRVKVRPHAGERLQSRPHPNARIRSRQARSSA
ncbi:hypothetical protein [Streptomyces sp. NPDC026589]|uniref:recombinase family protein n=1 Tax=Streptomyces sp. NPDC026589 TaxID=3155609 RepID=UPI0033C592FE